MTQQVELKGEVTFSGVVDAAECLFKQYTILRCSIIEYEKKYCFRETLIFSDLPIKHVFSEVGIDWDETWQNEIDIPIDSRGSLWRVTFVSSEASDEYALLLTCHHSIIDNHSLATLVSQFLNILDKKLNGEIVDIRSVPVSEPIDEFLKQRDAMTDTPAPVKQVQYEQAAIAKSRKTRAVDRMLDKEQHQRLAESCKKGNIRVHSVLGAALCTSVTGTGMAASPVSLKTAVSLRVFGPLKIQNTQELGCYISVADTSLDTLNNNFQELAIAYEKGLFAYILQNSLYKLKFNKFAVNAIANALNFGKAFSQGFAITNLGEVEVIKEYKRFSMQNYVTTINRLAGNFAISLQIDIFDENMRFRFVYPEPLLKREAVENVADDFLASIREFCGV